MPSAIHSCSIARKGRQWSHRSCIVAGQVTKLERIPKPKAEKPANTTNTDGGSSSDSSEKSTAEDEKLEEQHVEENGDSEQEEGVDQAGHDEL